MSIKVSTGLANQVSDRIGFRHALSRGRLQLYSGVQPTSSDLASNGTLLATITQSGAAFTAETLPAWTITLSGAAGSVDSIKVGGLDLLTGSVAFTTDLTTTAAAIATMITNNFSLVDYTATSSGAVVTINGPIGSGAKLNACVCSATSTTLTATISNSGAPSTLGVDAVGGLLFAFPSAAGLFSMSGSWSGLGVAAGTMGWFRYLCDGADNGVNATTTYRRFDGTVTVAGGGGDLLVDNVSAAVGQLINVTSFNMGVSKG